MAEEGDSLYLEAELAEGAFQLPTEYIMTKCLGRPRITEAAYENPDGTPVMIHKDLMGREMPSAPVPGPLQDLVPGRNRILLN